MGRLSRSPFQRGIPVYSCSKCGKRTRGTHRGEARHLLCLLCYLKGHALSVLAHSGMEHGEELFENEGTAEEIQEKLNYLLIGGDPDDWGKTPDMSYLKTY